ncbi:MAG: adenine-specific methyltransferase EcoRI family protein [Opitutales bacterium]|nr:adenine-specific methyltransferase EcoRI family protein [Opitutales bacterium]
MGGNKNLTTAKSAKKDEFYTQLCDIENELRHYTEHFRGKTVFCNCDDPYESNFFKYFALNFNRLGIRKLIATCYEGSPVVDNELTLNSKKPYKIVITEVPDMDGNGAIDLADVKLLIKSRKNILTELHGDGDFRSKECTELLKKADIIVTNPPFSLFREYVAQLVQHNKQFLIIGNQNAITYREIFPLIMKNKIWIGHALSYCAFKVPSHYEEKSNRFWIDETGQKWRSMGNICWFTNLDHPKRHEDLILYKNYNPEEYPKYDNYDAIEVSKTSEIPMDYDGVMGVPITFLDKFNPKQFEIIGKIDSGKIDEYNIANPIVNGKPLYKRLAIRRLH